MLSRADAEIARRDAALPGLATLLDAERLLAALRIACPRCAIEGLDISYGRYKPGVSCVIGFSLAVGGSKVTGYARTNAGNRAVAAMKAHRPPTFPSLLGKGRFALSDGTTVICVFPNDRRMTSLSEIAEPERLETLLRDLLPTAEHSHCGARVEPMAYRPEHSFVGKLVGHDGHQTVLKFPGDRAYRPMAFRSERFRGGSVRVAARLGYSDRHRAEVFEWLDGRPLSEDLQDPAFDIHTMWLVGAALADFHSHVRPGLVEITPVMTREVLQLHAVTISGLCPQLADLAHRVADVAGGSLADQPHIYRRLHGDFHPRQVLVNRQTVAFLDLDEGLVGDPTIDLGLFLAHLERESIRGRLSASQAGRLAESLLDGYEAAGGVPLRKWVPRAVAIGLIRLAPRSFRHREVDWAAQMAALLERAQEIANGQNHAAA
jgi:phosphotransferase family enzyme